MTTAEASDPNRLRSGIGALVLHEHALWALIDARRQRVHGSLRHMKGWRTSSDGHENPGANIPMPIKIVWNCCHLSLKDVLSFGRSKDQWLLSHQDDEGLC